MKRSIGTRAAIVGVALVAAGAVTVGVSQAAPEHRSEPAASQAAKPTKKQIAALFDGWNKALQTGDSKKVADRYAKDAVLLPTASPVIRTDRAGIVDYFDHFLLNKPKGTKIKSVINVLDSNSAIDAGLYVFNLTDPKTGEKKDVEARYTYEYEKRGGTWLIVNHHSSVLPAAS
ncbi:SgcJ/EcaC family oxidoreductase [Streptomyces sp. Qhu-G9]|uniref:SgcJ/EcaC family oxidoreductase n=1 Tax=Streptomyces sp. Qhu-G9 TaxID=3452799 RepID=UPI0022AC0252|nr:SgcJ/EcaC family oxidoreductase [Streptomyces aurantiacus]WAU78850.1 SgcJ/EcaC family oxidoreductase [Streptomyces aurantiacus]